MNPNKIIIVGGGSAGWMTAASLIKNFPEKEIHILDSSAIPTVGVGESTIQQINHWLNNLGLSDDDWMQECDASYKLSIKFTDFYKEGAGGFHYPFGGPQFDENYFPNGLNDWYVRKILQPDLPVQNFTDTFYVGAILSEHNKFPAEPIFKNYSENNIAYHFDAAKLAIFLRDKYCLPRGVVHHDNYIVDIALDTGGIQSVTCEDGTVFTADLFIDCTGFKSLLMNKLDVPFESYSEILPNNKAWATRIPYKNKEIQLEPYTNCTALKNGWSWNIPLWSRIGTGYVYSDKYVSDEQALEEFKAYLSLSHDDVENLEFRNINMRVGIHKEIFVKNVCAIGLSAGFIEPLESNGLYTIHEFLTELIFTLSKGKINQFDIDTFNHTTIAGFKSFAEFVSLHYKLSQRDDSEYWRDVTNRSVANSLNADFGYKNNGFDYLMFQRNITHNYKDTGGLICIATGLHHFPIEPITFQRMQFDQQKHDTSEYMRLFNIWDRIIADNVKKVKRQPTLFQYLSQYYT